MDAFARIPASERRLACLTVADAKRLQAASVDKDFWVCWTLREVFNPPDIGNHLTFKGGTSLSKAWGLIERFSEDIDLVVDKDVLGFAGDASPDRATGSNERRRRLDNLMEACRKWVQGELKPSLENAITERFGTKEGWHLEVDPDMADGQCLLFHYPSAFPATEAGYVRPVVKIELGARSDHWPADSRIITSYVAEVLPQATPGAAFSVSALAPERTFWEKAMLLHEETFRPANKPRRERMARHYYDVWCLITRGVADRAATDQALFARVAEHRQIFFRLGWVDYATLQPGTLRLTPSADHRTAWQIWLARSLPVSSTSSWISNRVNQHVPKAPLKYMHTRSEHAQQLLRRASSVFPELALLSPNLIATVGGKGSRNSTLGTAAVLGGSCVYFDLVTSAAKKWHRNFKTSLKLGWFHDFA